METPAEVAWITDPKAIDTIVALGELREGDEVILQHARSSGFPSECNGRMFRVAPTDKEIGSGYRYSDHPTVAELDGEYGGWVIVARNIKAWRRP